MQLLQKLSVEFFEEIKKKEESEVISHFGPPVGKLLLKHAALEQKFNECCLGDDNARMVPMDDPFISEEARQILIDIRGTTNKLLRAFTKREY